MKESAARAAGLVDDLFRQDDAALRVIGHFFPVDLDEPCPAAADADDIIAIVNGPDGNGADGRVEARDVAPPVRMPMQPLGPLLSDMVPSIFRSNYKGG
jgi:hypothetical protein